MYSVHTFVDLIIIFFLWRIFKNVSSSTSHTKTLKIWNCETLRHQDFSFYLSSTFIYELILIKIYMNANIMNTQIFHVNKFDLNGHWRSQKVTFMIILTFTYALMDNFLSIFFFKSDYVMLSIRILKIHHISMITYIAFFWDFW